LKLFFIDSEAFDTVLGLIHSDIEEKFDSKIVRSLVDSSERANFVEKHD